MAKFPGSIHFPPGFSFITHKAEGYGRFDSCDKSAGLTDQGFPTVPPLEPSLLAAFGVRGGKHVCRRLTPPSSGDQLTAKLADKVHQCASQVGAATKNMAMLALGVSKGVQVPSPCPAELDQIKTAADVITNMCAVLATCTAWISCWVMLLQKQMWLRLSLTLTEDIKWEL